SYKRQVEEDILKIYKEYKSMNRQIQFLQNQVVSELCDDKQERAMITLQKECEEETKRLKDEEREIKIALDRYKKHDSIMISLGKEAKELRDAISQSEEILAYFK
ncbi:hypothetical protein ADUPG1_012928, partial [Aduncisulcus paluster]